MDLTAFWESIRSSVAFVAIAIVGIVILFFVYYGFFGSTGKARVERVKIRAKQIIDSGEMPDDRTFNYVVYMLRRVPRDPEAVELLGQLQQLVEKANLAKRNAPENPDSGNNTNPETPPPADNNRS